MGQPLDASVAQAAAEWLLRLKEHPPGSADDEKVLVAFERWKDADPRHREAVGQMQPLLEQLGQWQDAPEGERRAAHAVLRRSQRRITAKSLGAGVALFLAVWTAGAGWCATQGLPLSALLADARTAVGETRSVTLADGSRVLLGSGTALSFERSGDRRALHLLGGDLLVDVAPDPVRPFTVITSQGTVTALGTRFLVREREDGTEVVMLESRTRVTPATSEASAEVGAGERVRLLVDRVEALPGIDADAEQASFEQRRLVVDDWPITRVLQELARHRPGVVRVDETSLIGVHFSGVLPLDDTDRALQLLVTGLPQLRVRTITPWLVRVDMTDPTANGDG